MYRPSNYPATVGLLVTILLVAGCAASTQPSNQKEHATTGATGFENILVIGIANDYEGRTQFERRLAKELSAAGMPATPMYIAAGGNKPIERDAIENLIATNGYDGVLISRVTDRDAGTSMRSGSASTKAVRRDDRPLDLFRYDYEELNEPATVNFNIAVTIYTELFTGAGNEQVWALESSISKKEHLEQVINEASEKIVGGLRRDQLIGR